MLSSASKVEIHGEILYCFHFTAWLLDESRPKCIFFTDWIRMSHKRILQNRDKMFAKLGFKRRKRDFFSHNFQDQVHIPCHGTQALAHQACLCLASSSATLCAHQSHEQTQLSHTLSYAHSVPFPWMPFFPHVPVAACTSKLNSHVASLIRYLFFLLLE